MLDQRKKLQEESNRVADLKSLQSQNEKKKSGGDNALEEEDDDILF